MALNSPRQTANEFCSVIHIRKNFGIALATELAEFLGFAEKDEKWISPSGEDMSDLCYMSDNGGLSGSWTIDGYGGYVLDDESMNALRREFPGSHRWIQTASPFMPDGDDGL